MNAIIASAAFDPRSPLLAVSIQSPLSGLFPVFGQEGTTRSTNKAFAAIVSQTDRLFVLNALSGGSWRGRRLPPAPLRYQFVSRPTAPLPNVSPAPTCEPLNEYAAQFGMLQSFS